MFVVFLFCFHLLKGHLHMSARRVASFRLTVSYSTQLKCKMLVVGQLMIGTEDDVLPEVFAFQNLYIVL